VNIGIFIFPSTHIGLPCFSTITAVSSRAQINFRDLTPYLTYGVQYVFVQAGLKVQPDALNFLILLRNKTDRFEMQLQVEIHPILFTLNALNGGPDP
jgi:hypothetical protein